MTARNSTEVESSGGRWIRSGGALSQDHLSLVSIRRPQRWSLRDESNTPLDVAVQGRPQASPDEER
jgi:hypothetical protein